LGIYEHGNEILGSLNVGNSLTNWSAIINFSSKILHHAISYTGKSYRKDDKK